MMPGYWNNKLLIGSWAKFTSSERHEIGDQLSSYQHISDSSGYLKMQGAFSNGRSTANAVIILSLHYNIEADFLRWLPKTARL